MAKEITFQLPFAVFPSTGRDPVSWPPSPSEKLLKGFLFGECMINLDDRILGEVDESQLFLLCAIAKHMGNNAKAWPSNEKLCKTTRWSESKLLRVKKSAIEAGLLGAESRYINNAQTSNLYQIKTRRIGVMVNLADVAPPSTNEAPPPSRMNTPPLQEWRAEVLTNEVLTNLTTTKEKIDVAVFDPKVNVLVVDSVEFKAEEVNSGVYAPPTAPRRFEAFDIDKEERMFLGAEDAMERYARETGTPRDKMYFGFQDAVKAFTADQKTTGYNYNNAIDYRKHFFNLVRRKAEIARNGQRAQPGASATQSNSPVPTNIRRL